MHKIWENDSFQAELESNLRSEAHDWLKRRKREEQGIVEMSDI